MRSGEEWGIMPTIAHTTILETLECCKCGMTLGLSQTWVKRARELGGFKQQFWCPYCGNQQGWGTSHHEKELERLNAELRLQQNNAAFWREQERRKSAEAEHFRKSRDGMKGALEKTKKRVSCGVCPCCNRSFSALARHMKTQHPDYAHIS